MLNEKMICKIVGLGSKQRVIGAISVCLKMQHVRDNITLIILLSLYVGLDGLLSIVGTNRHLRNLIALISANATQIMMITQL